jgi:hypothetical protein
LSLPLFHSSLNLSLEQPATKYSLLIVNDILKKNL